MYIKHSKFKNTGILFEILIKKITSDILNNKPPVALKLLKKHFTNTELGREYKLYEMLINTRNVSESKANTILTTLIEASKKMNRTSLRKQKYNLIKDLKENYNIDELFQTKINNYKEYAALYTLLEINNVEAPISPKQAIDNKSTLLEYLSVPPKEKSIKEDEVIKEYKSYDKDLRILTYHILIENFNNKYDNLNPSQKAILKEFITTVDNTERLKEFYNEEVKSIKAKLKEYTKGSKDVLKIKLEEVGRLLPELDKRKRINNDNLLNLLQYHSLLEELKILNE